MEEALIHEFIHYLFFEFKNYSNKEGDYPLWMEEGLAEFARCQYVKEKQGICFEDEKYLNSNLPLETLQTSTDWSNINEIDSAYYTSYIKVSEIIEKNGKDFLFKKSTE
ncbi:hypothetical protein [uncultured Metabacillus sp.]|uniref:hypothetical protein n=1 Tax=uncultured Metabacillus sp. TaxID=2860135 RepID=UPI00261BB2E2|nr:hypothetical protein [uncultured Metabacillus sp.]